MANLKLEDFFNLSALKMSAHFWTVHSFLKEQLIFLNSELDWLKINSSRAKEMNVIKW